MSGNTRPDQCVRRSWLCGIARSTKRDYEHRRKWLEERLLHLAHYFAVAVDAYAIMSNHFHLVVYFDPRESYRWSDGEVADRWLSAFLPDDNSSSENDRQKTLMLHRELLLQSRERLKHARQTLGSLSMFMKYLKQPIAYRANKEDRCTGHFFEGRFYSGALLDENAIVAAMAYVDLNPVRARIAQHIEDYRAASGYRRAQLAKNTPKRLKEAIQPLVSGLTDERPDFSITLEQFFQILKPCELEYITPAPNEKKSRWFTRISSLRKRQRAFGAAAELDNWKMIRGWSHPGTPLPAA